MGQTFPVLASNWGHWLRPLNIVESCSVTWSLQIQMQLPRWQGSLLNLRGNCEADWGRKGLWGAGGGHKEGQWVQPQSWENSYKIDTFRFYTRIAELPYNVTSKCCRMISHPSGERETVSRLSLVCGRPSSLQSGKLVVGLSETHGRLRQLTPTRNQRFRSDWGPVVVRVIT